MKDKFKKIPGASNPPSIKDKFKKTSEGSVEEQPYIVQKYNTPTVVKQQTMDNVEVASFHSEEINVINPLLIGSAKSDFSVTSILETALESERQQKAELVEKLNLECKQKEEAIFKMNMLMEKLELIEREKQQLIENYTQTINDLKRDKEELRADKANIMEYTNFIKSKLTEQEQKQSHDESFIESSANTSSVDLFKNIPMVKSFDLSGTAVKIFNNPLDLIDMVHSIDDQGSIDLSGTDQSYDKI